LDWANERYVRLYVRVDADEQFWPWEASAIFPQVLRRADRAGLISLGKHDPVKVVSKLIGFPPDVVAAGLEALLDDGCLVHRGGYLIFRNYLEANEAQQTEAHRKRESRARRKDLALLEQLSDLRTPASGNGTLPSDAGRVPDPDGDVPKADAGGRERPDSGHGQSESGPDRPVVSHAVTSGHSEPSEPSVLSCGGSRALAREGHPPEDPARTDPDAGQTAEPRSGLVLNGKPFPFGDGPDESVYEPDEGEDERPPLQPQWRLWAIWEQVAGNGKPGCLGDRKPFGRMLREQHAASETWRPKDPEGFWREVAELWFRERTAAGKSTDLDWLNREYASWAKRVAGSKALPTRTGPPPNSTVPPNLTIEQREAAYAARRRAAGGKPS